MNHLQRTILSHLVFKLDTVSISKHRSVMGLHLLLLIIRTLKTRKIHVPFIISITQMSLGLHVSYVHYFH